MLVIPYCSLESLNPSSPGLVGFGTTRVSRVWGFSYTVERGLGSIIHECVQVGIQYFTEVGEQDEPVEARSVYPCELWSSISCSSEVVFEAIKKDMLGEVFSVFIANNVYHVQNTSL